MSLVSAFDDFWRTSLSALPGLLTKIEYLSSLRQENGGYGHWGLSRVHGEGAAQRALSETHETLVSELLRTPLRSLMVDAEVSSEEQEMSVYLAGLFKRSAQLLPDEAGGGETRHFSSVLLALSALARSQQNAIHPAA